ncbi:MAG TPA: OmpW family outer membrane protein [Williamwhitmania sp.]|nr:OmpW family outer membrane protein [Williamwhitmania sp.]
MKTKLTIIAVLLTVANVHAQTENFKHFEVDASINFWTPSSLHMKATNSVTQVNVNNNYTSSGGINGYGTSVAPALNLTYYFKNNLGISLGVSPIIMDNKLHVVETDSTFSNYENEASIIIFTLGLSGRIPTSSPFSLNYGFGINFVPAYDLMMTLSTESSDPPDMEATGMAVGVYFNAGAKIKITNSIYFNTALAYSFIPVELEYTNGEHSAKINEKTNLGGLALQTGLSYSF